MRAGEKRAVKRRKDLEVEPRQHGMLLGADAIAAFFRVSRRTVMEWIKDGAPVVPEKRRYDADSATLQAWREAVVKKKAEG